jgi:hypothetical protein
MVSAWGLNRHSVDLCREKSLGGFRLFSWYAKAIPCHSACQNVPRWTEKNGRTTTRLLSQDGSGGSSIRINNLQICMEQPLHGVKYAA